MSSTHSKNRLSTHFETTYFGPESFNLNSMESPSCPKTISENFIRFERFYAAVFQIPNLKLRTYEAKSKQTEQQDYGVMSSEELERIQNHSLYREPDSEKQTSPITGNRIVELGYVLQTVLDIQYNHCLTCTFGKIIVQHEIRTSQGLVSTVALRCTMCNKMFHISTEEPRQYGSLINLGAVWGTLATGSTYSHCNEFLSCLDIPMIPEKFFSRIELELGNEWKSSLWRSMKEAGAEEKEHALRLGDVCEDGTPWITVYIDGSWSKRSYGNNYNALSGMIGIIGRHTGKVLFIAVRNKYCCICARADNSESMHKEKAHTCYKNWNGSAPAMEADMAVEGFNLSEEMHGVRYRQFIGDGDSSVFAKLRQNVKYGQTINKIECSNHALKNYGKHLYKIKKDTNIKFEGRKLLTLIKINQLQKRAKCSIYEHSKNEQNVALLRQDLKNGLHHVYGDHSVCREGICNNVGDQSENQIPLLKSTFIYSHLSGALELLIRKAHLLIKNENNNRAERLMNVVSRFNMGKRLNLIQRNSYETRVYLAGLRITGTNPGTYMTTFMNKTDAKTHSSRKRLFSDSILSKAKKPKPSTTKNRDYGANVEEPEIESDTLQIECDLLLQKLKVIL
ncbi:hypothetical protein RI129_006283 [Pyrocoelia pectoralis]|uniref:Mutator-like transposase domain-containing protein n=1 Tax=Pyrocoelia pectoralis TaxID=417401 RepID=A0AAN7VDV6_9COLE